MRDLSAGPSLLSVNTATVRKQAGLLEIIEACARHGIAAISPWRDQVAAVGLERAARAIKDAGLKLSGYCRGGLFPATGEHVAAARDDNRRAVDEAAALGAPCVILVAGGLPQFARPGSTPSNDIADRLDAGGTALGVAVDVYHTWWDPDLYAGIARAGRDKRLIAYHVCDWLVPTKDMLNDRGMMGDGVVDLHRIRRAMEDAGYTGLIEAEIFSDYWWAQPIDHVLATCVERYRTVV